MKNKTGFFNRDPWLKIILHLKDVYFTHHFEHLYRAAKYAKRSGVTSKTSSVILDAGAYNGSSALFLSKQFPNCKIKAFEPNPIVLDLLKKNCAASPNIDVFPFALSDKSGKSSFHVTHNHVASSLHPVNNQFYELAENASIKDQVAVVQKMKVDVKKLDDFNFGEVLVLKMDCQGNEKNILLGATETLKRTFIVATETLKRTFIVATEMLGPAEYVGGCHYYEVDELLRKLGFEAVDWVVPYRRAGITVTEFDMIYVNTRFKIEN